MSVQVEKTYPKPLRAFPSGINDKEKGLTLRDYFAAKAMQGLLASKAPMQSELPDPISVITALATSSYRIADAMLEERNKQ